MAGPHDDGFRSFALDTGDNTRGATVTYYLELKWNRCCGVLGIPGRCKMQVKQTVLSKWPFSFQIGFQNSQDLKAKRRGWSVQISQFAKTFPSHCRVKMLGDSMRKFPFHVPQSQRLSFNAYRLHEDHLNTVAVWAPQASRRESLTIEL